MAAGQPSSPESATGAPPLPLSRLRRRRPRFSSRSRRFRPHRPPAPTRRAAAARASAPQPGSLSLVSDAWEVHTENPPGPSKTVVMRKLRSSNYLTENNDFVVIGIIGPPGVGKSTIMNALYGYDGNSPGMHPPFAMQNEETKAMAKHCTAGVDFRISHERVILLDTQPVYSPSILIDMMRPDGSSTLPVLNGDPLPADLAHELMGIQLGIFLASVCNILLVVSEGINDFAMWELMLTVDLLKNNIPDPSLLTSSSSPDKENKNDNQSVSEDYMADLCFVHARATFCAILDRIRKFDVEVINGSNTDNNAAYVIGGVVSHYYVRQKCVSTNPVRDSKKAFAQRDKDRNMEDGIGGQLVQESRKQKEGRGGNRELGQERPRMR
ncbi:hypothetical protein QYE76_017557 [Lolium multiflorum]|uniref:Protein SMG9 n=1 Tax=Lolium multiflorum TaxID=4521 RepID=A0AAD8Q975_LOLMU|nr:hypothetical protein QYE76_017557 [Lolium multiflorum]